MSDTADRYRRLVGEFAGKVAQVSPDGWDSPSPCEGWTARDVVAHIVDVHGLFERLVGRPFEPTIRVDDDPLGAVREAGAVVEADLDDPVRAEATFDGVFGRQTFAAAIDRFICFDLAIHGWDLARAAGLNDRIDPSELPRLRATAEEFGDNLHQAKVCGPAVEVADDADEQSKLLALLGRRA
jgi:uncharacterized protein (TIGR03086 family)